MNNNQKLINYLKENKFNKLEKIFDTIDGKSNTINDWQRFLSYDLNSWSCSLVHKIRIHLMNYIIYTKKDLPGIAQISLKQCLHYLQEGEKIRNDLNELHEKIVPLLYPE